MRDWWTEQDLARLPQDGTRYEIVDGRLYATPPQGESHQGPLGMLLCVLHAAAPPGCECSALVVEVASRSTEKTDRGNKMIAYAEGGIPAYWRVTRDGIVHMHRLMEKGEYGLLATVKPGEQHEVLWPFPLILDPAKLRSAEG